MWHGIRIKGFINIDKRDFIRAERWQRNNNLDDLWYDMPKNRQVCEIYNIEDIFDLIILFGLQLYEAEQAPEK